MKKTIKKKKAASRSSASYKNRNVKSEKISDYKYDSKPSVIMSDKTSNEGHADRALKDLVRGNVFKSNPQTVKQTNSNKRRYA